MTPKAEALAALTKVWHALTDDRPIDGLARVELAAAVKFAHGRVEEIEELRRARRKPKA